MFTRKEFSRFRAPTGNLAMLKRVGLALTTTFERGEGKGTMGEWGGQQGKCK